jgi:NAD(P)-dependent dehydrogenase (short-subunit alcohol dehydrogenase family)
MNTYNFTGKTFLVTGASSGIGQEIALRLASEGANLYLIGRNSQNLNITKDKCFNISISSVQNFQTIILDLENEEKIQKEINNIGFLNGVVFGTGRIEPFPTAFLNKKKIDSLLHTNLYTSVLLTSALLKNKKILPDSSLVFISSISSVFPHLGGALYSASKAALEAYMRTVALEYSYKRIRANAICPGMIKTPLFDRAIEIGSKEAMDKHLLKYPLGVGYPSDVANLTAFLLSNQSRWITGNSIVLDGGLHLGF